MYDARHDIYGFATAEAVTVHGALVSTSLFSDVLGLRETVPLVRMYWFGGYMTIYHNKYYFAIKTLALYRGLHTINKYRRP